MTLTPRKVLLALVVFAPVACVWALSGCSPAANVSYPEYQPPASRPTEELKKLPVGLSGCMGAACHGAPAEKTLAGQIDRFTWQSSGSCWTTADPHTAAYSLLTDNPYRRVNVTAKQIMERYAKDTPNKPATEEARCVACHTNPALAREELMNDAHSRMLREEGVSCEACHGNAGKWINDHTTWKGDRDTVYKESGMVPLYNLGERAKNCLGCHVGAPPDPERGLPVRDMNHDMIAAGHPRLNFDFAEYIRRLPQHWQEKDRANDKPLALNDVKVWYVGRVAHAEAACALLKDRAERVEKNDEKTPWPEFAEFNCAACHHHLSVEASNADPKTYPNWRRKETYLGDRPAGAIPWQMIWPMNNAPGIAKPERKQSQLWPVLDVMEKVRPAKYGDAKRIATETHSKMQQLRMSLVTKPDTEAEREALAFFPTAGGPTVPEWDSATQLFFAYAAEDRKNGASKAKLDWYAKAVTAFRAQNRNPNQMPNWLAVEEAFRNIRPR